MRKWLFLLASALVLLWEPVNFKIYSDNYSKDIITTSIRKWRVPKVNIIFVNNPKEANLILKPTHLERDCFYIFKGNTLQINSTREIADYELEGLVSYVFGKYLLLKDNNKHSVMNPTYSIQRKHITKYDWSNLDCYRVRLYFGKLKFLF